MPKNSCIICGKSDKNLQENILPHGTIYCHFGCKNLLNYLLNDAIPLVWLGKADLEDREYYTSEELETITPEALILASEEAADSLWDGNFGETFGDTLRQTAVAIETDKVYNTPKKELPLLMGKLKFRESEKLLTQRMKEE